MSKRTTPTIARAVDWIAENDDGITLSIDEIELYISTILVADMFGKTPRDIANRILKVRLRGGW